MAFVPARKRRRWPRASTRWRQFWPRRRRRLLDELDLEALALDAAGAETLDRALGGGLGDRDVREAVVDFDFADFGAAEAAGFAGESAQDVAGAELVFAPAGETERFHFGVERG